MKKSSQPSGITTPSDIDIPGTILAWLVSEGFTCNMVKKAGEPYLIQILTEPQIREVGEVRYRGRIELLLDDNVLKLTRCWNFIDPSFDLNDPKSLDMILACLKKETENDPENWADTIPPIHFVPSRNNGPITSRAYTPEIRAVEEGV